MLEEGLKGVEKKKKNAFLAALANVFILGLGYLDVENWRKGVLIFFVGIMGAILFGFLGIFIVYIYAIVDCYQEARRINGESSHPIPTKDIVGLVVAGGFILIATGTLYLPTSESDVASPENSTKISCPYDCCINLDNYYNKICAFGNNCINHECTGGATEHENTEDVENEKKNEIAYHELDENISISIKQVISFREAEELGESLDTIYKLDAEHSGPHYDYKDDWKFLIVDLIIENKSKISFQPSGEFKIKDSEGYTYDEENYVGWSPKTAYFGTEKVQPKEQLTFFVAFTVPNDFEPDTLIYESNWWDETNIKTEFNLR